MTVNKDISEINLNQTANDLVDVKDIKNDCLYTKSGYLIKFLKFEPFNISLMNECELEATVEAIAAGFRGNNLHFELMSYSREINMDNYKADIAEKILEEISSAERKVVLEIMKEEAIELSSSGDNFEQEFALKIWKKVGKDAARTKFDLQQLLKEIRECFAEGKIKTNIMTDVEITKLCNLFSNSSQAQYEEIKNMGLEGYF